WAFRARAHERQHGRMWRLRGERLQEAMNGVVRGESVVVEQDPAHRFVPLIVCRCKMAGGLRKPRQDRTRLRHPRAVDFQHRNLAHLVNAGAPVRVALLATGKIDTDRHPVETGAIEVQGDLEGISGRTDAIESVMSHGKIPCACSLPDAGAASIGSSRWRQLAAISKSLLPLLRSSVPPYSRRQCVAAVR